LTDAIKDSRKGKTLGIFSKVKWVSSEARFYHEFAPRDELGPRAELSLGETFTPQCWTLAIVQKNGGENRGSYFVPRVKIKNRPQQLGIERNISCSESAKIYSSRLAIH
jgi:hypothetical protein